MTVEHSSKSLTQVVNEASSGNILLPNFQRQFVWTADAHRQIAASVLINIPCGSLLLVTGKSTDFSSRRVGHSQSETDNQTGTPCEFLLDGQQRVSTLRALFSDPFEGDWIEAYNQTFTRLRSRWSMRVKPAKPEDPDLFGWKMLRFKELPPEPDLVSDAIVQHPVTKTKNFDKWAHPAFERDAKRSAQQLRIGASAAADGQVPLWEVCNSDEFTIAKNALDEIAEDRRKEMLAAIRDNELSLEDLDNFLKPDELPEDVTDDEVDNRLRDRKYAWIQAILNLLRKVKEFKLSTITLTADELSKAIAIFEAINRGGTPLSAFDLVTARYARGQSGHSLPELVQDFIAQYPSVLPPAVSTKSAYTEWAAEDNVGLVEGALTTNFKTQFLQSMSMNRALSRHGPGHRFTVDEIKPQNTLQFSSADVDEFWQPSCDAILQAWRFLQIRCGVKDEGALRNKLLILPIAVTLPTISESDIKKFDMVEYWYWCSVLTNTYTNRQNENAAADANQLREWLANPNGPNPFSSREQRVFNDEGYSSRETLLRTSEESRVGTDVGQYLLQFVCASGGRDLLTDQLLNVQRDSLQDHHLIPLATATTIGQSSSEIRKGKTPIAELLNSPLNRAYVLKSTNLSIGSKSLQQYISSIKDSAKSSIHLTLDSSYTQKDSNFDEYARDTLGARFDQVKSAAVKHLSNLRPAL
ncbi:DUF262 domain-containing protein [Gordonia amicalis]|uniref:DUF262 domain-containing protein n=1 Tax=Gordonia amicalis TaxID=89053 RepID=UPI00200A2AAD|nr:DUF262 domain-containing protein [Gordonia amicalis]UPW14580.1 DUF262 domain-containing protein [Gordonia amicalis]